MNANAIPPLGVIEGYYGRPWSWADRTGTIETLAPAGYDFYLYAPKADAYLRRRWREPHPAGESAALSAFAKRCETLGVAFGVGLSPFELYLDFGDEAKAALDDKLAHLESLGVRQLAILFDDMRGDREDLARRQIEILHWVGERSTADRLIFCPTYYSDEPALDRFFGQRPAHYLETLGEDLDPGIDIFWTGPEVCSRELRVGHIERVAASLRRPPLIWDNYPVNDGPRMSPFLHLRAFTGRDPDIGALVRGHAVNPALQPILSRIPALTLPRSYADGAGYDYRLAFEDAALSVLGPELASLVSPRLSTFQEGGRSGLGDGLERMVARFAAVDHPAAREIVDWLNGAWCVTAEEIAAS